MLDRNKNVAATSMLPVIICSVMDWKNMDREEAVKKDCAERLSKPFGNSNKYGWVGIGVATMRS